MLSWTVKNFSSTHFSCTGRKVSVITILNLLPVDLENKALRQIRMLLLYLFYRRETELMWKPESFTASSKAVSRIKVPWPMFNYHYNNTIYNPQIRPPKNPQNETKQKTSWNLEWQWINSKPGKANLANLKLNFTYSKVGRLKGIGPGLGQLILEYWIDHLGSLFFCFCFCFLRERERGRKKIPNRHHTQHGVWYRVGSHDHEIMTWAEIKS